MSSMPASLSFLASSGTRFCGHVKARLKRDLSLCTLREQDSYCVGEGVIQAKTRSVLLDGRGFASKLKAGRVFCLSSMLPREMASFCWSESSMHPLLGLN